MGMAVIHHCARYIWPEEVARILALSPEMASVRTFPARSPGNWTPSHCLSHPWLPRPQSPFVVQPPALMPHYLSNLCEYIPSTHAAVCISFVHPRCDLACPVQEFKQEVMTGVAQQLLSSMSQEAILPAP